jgi:hypothetical protein
MYIIKRNFFLFSILIISLISCKKESFQTKNLKIELSNAVNRGAIKTFSIGQSYGGGYIFYIDGTGQHGLIISVKDLDGGPYSWSPSAPGLPIGALSEDGDLNTSKIIKAYGNVPKNTKPYAALAAKQYSNNGIKGWYLPSYIEIQKLNEPRRAGISLNIGSDTQYLTSSEDPFNGGGYQVLEYSSFAYAIYGTGKDILAYAVRPIRKF